MFIKTLVVLAAISMGNAVLNDYGYLPRCPNAHKSFTITPEAIEKHVIVITHNHFAATATSRPFVHRRRYKMSAAVKGIGADPLIDFKTRKTAVFLDGYMDSGNFPSARILVGNWAAMGYNTISVDTQTFYSMSYPVAIRAGFQVGNITAQLLQSLVAFGLNPKDIELVGISLGGQTISYTAKYFYNLTGIKIGRILGMDPAGACYRGMEPQYRLQPSDADFVQVVHTDIDGMGMADPLGHVDFYINGGEHQFIVNDGQPWCEEFCSHVLSIVFSYASLRMFPGKFVGIKCKNVQQAREHRCYENEQPYQTNVIGFGADINKPGIYYVPVDSTGSLYAPDGWMTKKIVYPVRFNDAFSCVDNFVVNARNIHVNTPPIDYIERFLNMPVI